MLQHGSILVEDDQPLVSSLADDVALPPPAATLAVALGRRPLVDEVASALFDTVRDMECVDADELQLTQDAHGRPRLDPRHGTALDFNWSHSGDHALVAIARGIAPGVDVERRRARPRALALARRFFDAAETAALAALPVGARDDAFLTLWTAKEALLKAHGRGIGYGLQRLRVAAPPQPLQLLRFDGEDVGAWQLQRLDLAPELVAALAWRGSPRKVRAATLLADIE